MPDIKFVQIKDRIEQKKMYPITIFGAVVPKEGSEETVNDYIEVYNVMRRYPSVMTDASAYALIPSDFKHNGLHFIFNSSEGVKEYIITDATQGTYAPIGGGSSADTPFEYTDSDSSKGAVLKGSGSSASAAKSAAIGNTVRTTATGEVAVGKYNNTVSGSGSTHSMFTVGVGTGNSAKKSAIAVMTDSSVYMVGIGGYAGDSSIGISKSVQKVVADMSTNLSNAIAELSDHGNQIAGLFDEIGNVNAVLAELVDPQI